jgi:hypothetical protein
MFRVIAKSLLCLATLCGSAAAGDFGHRAPWYDQPPVAGTGPGYYYSQHPDHIPAWPKPLTGYAVPIYDTAKPVVHALRVVDAHGAWCAARYRSYDWQSDTWQPHRGGRRVCWSPWR